MQCSIIDYVNYTDKSAWMCAAEKGLSFLSIALQGRRVTLVAHRVTQVDEKVHAFAMRLLAGILAVLLFPLTLSALAIKWWCQNEWKPREGQDVEEASVEIKVAREKPADRQSFIEHVCQDKEHLHALDVKLGTPQEHTWRAYGQRHGEKNQTFEDYVELKKEANWPDQRSLEIKQTGTFSDLDLKIVKMTSDYLAVFHQLPVNIHADVMTMQQLKEKYNQIIEAKIERLRKAGDQEKADDLKRFHEEVILPWIQTSFPRDDGRYAADLALDLMEEVYKDHKPDQPEQIIAFTSEDLFTMHLSNFVFGCASLTAGMGIWSNARFGDPDKSPATFESCLKRMMKISAHEFGHMRGLPHCTDYECNMGGYMNLQELDDRPLLYCAQDTAKIAYLTHTDLLVLHQEMLDFFQNFNQTYQVNCDFSSEIRTLKARIAKLQEQA